MLKNQTRLIDRETATEWRLDRRTRGEDVVVGGNAKPVQNWILILTNRQGHRRFVPEARVWEFFEPAEQKDRESAG